MTQYAVHLYTQVRVKVSGIEADTPVDAIDKAEGIVDLHDLCDNKAIQVGKYDLGGGMAVEAVEWAEGETDAYLVDPMTRDEVDYEKSRWYGPDRQELVGGDTTIERKAKQAHRAALFIKELGESVETLSGIAETHGVRTLSDLLYLAQAILEDGEIDNCNDSRVMDFVRDLPSGARWATFLRNEAHT